MKKILIYIISAAAIILALPSCELDNYPGPDAEIYGTIYDIETNEPVRQDIMNGTKIEYIEHGYENPETQYMVIKNDGSYMNKLMFSGTYTVHLRRGNFVELEEQEVKVSGVTELNFKVQPYIRIKNARIEKVGNTIVATFNVQTTLANQKIKKIGLYSHLQDYVGEPAYTAGVEKNINAVVDENQEQKIALDLDAYINDLRPGKQYYFIVGALLDVPEAKLNYAPPVRIRI